MIRMQVQFTEDQVAALKRIAADRHQSIASVVRDAVDAQLEGEDRDARVARALSVVGRYRSGTADRLGAQHDRHLAAIYAEQ